MTHKQNMIFCFMQRIHLPEVNYFVTTPIGGRFTYTMDGTQHYYHITNHKEQCEILHSQNMIDGYNETALWVIEMDTLIRANGSFDMQQRLREVYWSDFEFTQDQALEIVAEYEFRKTARIMNLPATVINLFTRKIKAA